MDLDSKLLPNKTASTLTTEEVLGTDVLDHIGVQRLELHLNGVGLVRTIVLETEDCPRTLDGRSSLLDFLQESTLDLALVDKSREGVPGVDETGATGPAAGAVDTLLVGQRIPEGDIVDLGGVIGHNLALNAQVAKDFNRPGLNTVGATSSGRHGAVVDVLNLVSPSRHAKRQQDTYGASAHDHDVILFLGFGHGWSGTIRSNRMVYSAYPGYRNCGEVDQSGAKRKPKKNIS